MSLPAQGPPDGMVPPTPLPRGEGLLRRVSRSTTWIRARLFVDAPIEPADSSGRLAGWPAEPYMLLAAMTLATLFAVLLGLTAARSPVPPGGDPGQWLTTSYAYVGLPYPSWIIPGQYPPVLFPILGLLVRLGGGPLEGARLYLGVVAVLVGLSTYYLARSLVAVPVVALLAEGFVLLNPSFDQLFFFGAYPNLLGLVFLNLALASLVRYARTARSGPFFLTWLFLAAAILTHSLVGVMLLATLSVATLALWAGHELPWPRRGRLPRWSGPVLAVGAVTGFYLATRALGIVHPNYVSVSAFAFVKNGLGGIYFLLLHPFFPTVRPDVGSALMLLVGLVAAAVVALVGTGLLAPGHYRPGLIAPAAMVIAAAGLALAGWELSIFTDYVRFGYFLVTPIVLGLAVGIDAGLRWLIGPRPSSRSVPLTADAPPRGPADGPRRSRIRRRWVRGIVLSVAVAALLVFADVITVPAMAREEFANTRVAHDQAFLDAVRVIESSGIRGAVLTVPGASKWVRALLAANSYAPLLPGRYSFDSGHTLAEELAFFYLTDRYAVDDGTVAAAVSGQNTSLGGPTPIFEAAYYGAFTPVLSLPTSGISVTVRAPNGSVTQENVTGVPRFGLPATPATPALSEEFVVPGATVEVQLLCPPNATSTVLAHVIASPSGGSTLLALNLTLANPSGGMTHFGAGSAAGALRVLPSSYRGALAGDLSVQPASALGPVSFYNRPGNPAHAVLRISSNGGPAEIQLAFSDPGAANLVSTLPAFISTPAGWADWAVRFVLYEPPAGHLAARAGLRPDEVRYLVGEFGATVLAVRGEWTVLLLPALPTAPT